MPIRCLLIALLVPGVAPLALGTVTAIRGSADVSVQEVVNGVDGNSEKAFDSFPETSTQLPLQVVARLVNGPPTIGAGVAAAQFADPRLVAGPNPGEFAINLSLDSVTPDIRHVSRATVIETREVVFNEGELGTQPAGTAVQLVGRLTIEGTLAMFSADAGRDFRGARVALLTTVTRSQAGAIDEIVFSGQVILEGIEDGRVQVSTTGQFPASSLILTNLAGRVPSLFAFQAVILPNVPIVYSYDAVVGEPFELTATVEIVAENVAGNCGVAALLGTPTDLLADVIGATQGDATAKSLLAALADERAAPSGEPAIAPPPLVPFCGLLSFELLLPMAIAPLALRRGRRAAPSGGRNRAAAADGLSGGA